MLRSLWCWVRDLFVPFEPTDEEDQWWNAVR